MVTEKEMRNYKMELEFVYGVMTENELRDKMKIVSKEMTFLYERFFKKWASGDMRGADVVSRLLHSTCVKTATIAKMLEEAKKRG